VDLEYEYLKGTVTKKVDWDDFECAGGGARENVGPRFCITYCKSSV
jgi:hypothetical protein